jgi:hypothetical protein
MRIQLTVTIDIDDPSDWADVRRRDFADHQDIAGDMINVVRDRLLDDQQLADVDASIDVTPA